ncbi:tryptophanyl-tRNA synthetase [Laetiporus sulphureus 93-53]|uniref:Tryptophan--tRNA ligase, mitochondrial n=1 Tax=Laetiporus sulphureus 93-53 TaxID=1314785 RepID=A0A165H2G2_9APHY|nr:tryptophanyl-tRNA synthetase [Laetiporus sulphureus 93-53]KZT11153.1 tryptophanyl-tRNA synthetase [Laetiporus sulphureus 93-53]
MSLLAFIPPRAATRPTRRCLRLVLAEARHAARGRLYSGGVVGEPAANAPAPRVVFSGVQPTGIPHLGNFLGALLNWVKLQQDAKPDDQLIFSIAGWHALTLPQDPKALSAARREMMAVLLAIGLDPERSVIFHQDENPHHTDLAWVLSCITPMGKLRRMTTWKSRLATSRNARDESEVDESLLNAGLFTYPVLQAADILAYKATHVPVGEDQQQHLELCRDLADSFNRSYKSKRPLFPLPQHVITPSRRILSLKDPSSKMSKSAPDVNSRILLTDDAAQIKAKIRGAVTDTTVGVTYDPVNRPGAANLLTILAACMDEDVTEVAKRYHGKGHGHLKKDVTEAVQELLKKPRAEFERLKGETDYLSHVSSSGAAKARELSETTMREVRERLGLI